MGIVTKLVRPFIVRVLRTTPVVPLIFGISLVGCKAEDPDSTAEGPGGPCRDSDSCADGQSCELGFCVPEDCTVGAKDCRCHADGTCSAPSGDPLSCIENVCVETESPDEGALGASCESENDCDEDLRCVWGRCEMPGCPSGQLDCPCGSFGSCESYSGTELRCSDDGRCVTGACEAGSAACPCRAEGTECDGDLVCRDGRCLWPRFVLQVGAEDVVACDVVFEGASEAPISEVRFSGEVRGQEHDRKPERGVSFFVGESGALSSSPLWVEAKGSEEHPPALVRSRCFDDEGAVVDDPELELLALGGER